MFKCSYCYHEYEGENIWGKICPRCNKYTAPRQKNALLKSLAEKKSLTRNIIINYLRDKYGNRR